MRPKNIEQKQRRRPRQTRANQTYETILEGAAHVLEERGEHGFTTNQIAERAGVSIGSLYQYFESKQDILVALAERQEAQLPNRQKLADSAASSDASPLRLGLRAYINMLPEHPVARSHALDEVLNARGPSGVGEQIDQRCVESGLYEGLDETDRFVVSRAIAGVVQSAVREQRDDLQSRAFEDSLVKLVRAFLRSGV